MKKNLLGIEKEQIDEDKSIDNFSSVSDFIDHYDLSDDEYKEILNIESSQNFVIEEETTSKPFLSLNTDDSLKWYLHEISKYPLLTSEAERELAIKKDQGDREAFEKLYESNLRLVTSIAKKYNVKSCDFMDIVQEGNLGLRKAIEFFDYTMGKFSTYAAIWIRRLFLNIYWKIKEVLKFRNIIGNVIKSLL